VENRNRNANLLNNKICRAGTMHLNEPLLGFDYNFLDGVDANPSYCTQQNPDVHFQRLYGNAEQLYACILHALFLPFLQSTQWSEGFNAVLKKYVNPNMSVLHFVR
jgi:hypothetical protein